MTETANPHPAESSEQPVAMLNVLWFRPDDGREQYARYAAAAAPHLERAGARLATTLQPDALVLGQGDPTGDLASADAIFVVEWPSWRVFLETVQSAVYQEIAPLREQALERSLLVRCAPVGTPFS